MEPQKKKQIKKIIIEIFPLLLVFFGSIMLTLSLKLIDTCGKIDLGNGLTATGGCPIFMGIPLSIPQQNNTLFMWGMIFFIVGSIWEIIKIIVKNVRTSANQV